MAQFPASDGTTVSLFRNAVDGESFRLTGTGKDGVLRELTITRGVVETPGGKQALAKSTLSENGSLVIALSFQTSQRGDVAVHAVTPTLDRRYAFAGVPESASASSFPRDFSAALMHFDYFSTGCSKCLRAPRSILRDSA
jgi:hypothetical protein